MGARNNKGPMTSDKNYAALAVDKLAGVYPNN